MSQFEKLLLTWILLVTLASSAPLESNSSVKIIGGTNATSQEFPFLVSIQSLSIRNDSNLHLCGGTLVSLSRIITAAHCLEDFQGEDGLGDLVIAAGSNLHSHITKGILQQRQARRVTIHPNYNPNRSTKYNDIAVIDLMTPFIAEATIASLPLASRNQQSTGKCQIAGWGVLTPSEVDYNEQLIKATVTINSQQQCQTADQLSGFDSEYQICAGGLNGETVGACHGDFGGPLICTNQDGSRYLAGVSSWGPLRCGSNPTVFMAIGKYRTWLDSVLSGGSSTTTTTTTKRPKPPAPSSDELVEYFDDDDDSFEIEHVDSPAQDHGC